MNTALEIIKHTQKQLIMQVDDAQNTIQFVALGELLPDDFTASARTATERLQRYFDGLFVQAFSGLTVYFGNNIISGGGETFPDENVIVIDASKGFMSVAEAEAYLVENGVLNEGDWTRVVSTATYAELTILHEVAHLMEARIHGAQGRALNEPQLTQAPTKYGRSALNEGYAETFVYDVYGAPINSKLRTILRKDVAQVMGEMRIVSFRV
jgi:hypothetical protein